MSTDCKQKISADISKEQKDFLQLIIHEDAATSLSGAVQWCIDACMRIEKLYGVDACYVSFNDIRKDDPTPSTNNQREGEKDVPDIHVGEIPQLPVNQVWDLSGMPDDQKRDFVDGMVKITAENFLKVFVMLGLKDGIESGVVNEATGDQFILIFKKLKYPAYGPAGNSEIIICELCRSEWDINNGDCPGCGARITKRHAEAPSLSVEESVEVEWLEKCLANEKQSFARLTELLNRKETELSSLRGQLSEAKKDRDAWKERFEKATKP